MTKTAMPCCGARMRPASRAIIAPAIDLATCAEVLRLAETHEGVFAAVGVHPNSTSDIAAADIDQLRYFAAHPKVVAIGEIGLDYHWDRSPKLAQADAFAQQLDLASKLEMPVIIHNRDASQDVLETSGGLGRRLRPPA